MFINGEYFIKDLAGLDFKKSLDIDSDITPAQYWVDKYSRLLLQNALGHIEFDDLESQTENNELKSDADQKWKDLVNGKTYTFNDKPYKWKGLIYTEGTFKESVLANYVFFKWHEETMTRMSGQGETKGSTTNNVNVSGNARSVRVWNRYVEMYQGLRTQTKGTLTYINDTPFYDYYSKEDATGYVSLLKFLEHNKETYPTATLIQESGFINQIGL